MHERRWPVIAAVAIGVLVVAAIGWAIGRASAPEDPAQGEGGGGPGGAIRVIDGVPVGVQQSRAGALAAADNYVAVSSETVVQDPRRYEKLVRSVYAPNYQPTALKEGEDARASATDATANYDAGGRAVSIIAARRLDTYAADRAQVTTWRSGVVWGPSERPAARWFLTETALRWDGQRWLVEKIDDARRSAPSPILRFRDREATRTSAFDRELRGMTAPSYGVGG